jgi:hypothetical protein
MRCSIRVSYNCPSFRASSFLKKEGALPPSLTPAGDILINLLATLLALWKRAKVWSNANNECMKTNTVDYRKAKAAPGNAETRMRRKWAALGLLFVVVMIGASGCADPYYGGGYYGGGPYYGGGYYSDGPYYAGARRYYGRSYYGRGPYGPGYGSGYAAYPGSVTIAVGDRPYYTRGPGYYVGRTYYVWRPGRWAWQNGQRVWIRGRYVVRR